MIEVRRYIDQVKIDDDVWYAFDISDNYINRKLPIDLHTQKGVKDKNDNILFDCGILITKESFGVGRTNLDELLEELLKKIIF